MRVVAGPEDVDGFRPAQGRCLVLGGGGVSGIAWLLGVAAGLAREGLRLGDADTFIGTSAGSVVATQLAQGADLEALLAAQCEAAAGEVARPYSIRDADERSRRLLARMGGDLAAARRYAGAFALKAETPPLAGRRAVIAGRLPSADWPPASLRVTAMDAETGRGRVFRRDGGVPLVDAVMASCAVPGAWPVVPLQERRYVDGGMRSITNADLALGARRVLVLAPLGWRDGNPVTGRLRSEVAVLEAAGAQVQVLLPDEAAAEAIGDDVLDPARRPASARAGLRQAPSLRAVVHHFLSS